MAAARAVLEGPPDAAALQASAQAFGLIIDLPEVEPLPVWPEHWPALRLFMALQTQWRLGPTGRPCGLIYEVLPMVEARLGISAPAALRAFPFLQQLEVYALQWFRERAKA